MPLATANGTDLFYEISGTSGDPVVLVHGSWVDHHDWDAVAPLLARTHRVLAYDRRGHSRSPRPATQGSVREDADDLAVLLEQLGLAPAHVVASSFGGIVALRLAVTRPDLVRSLAVHEPPLFSLVAGDPAAAGALTELQKHAVAVLGLIGEGDGRAAAELFVETIALGPGSWAMIPEPVRAGRRAARTAAARRPRRPPAAGAAAAGTGPPAGPAGAPSRRRAGATGD